MRWSISDAVLQGSRSSQCRPRFKHKQAEQHKQAEHSFGPKYSELKLQGSPNQLRQRPNTIAGSIHVSSITYMHHSKHSSKELRHVKLVTVPLFHYPYVIQTKHVAEVGLGEQDA